MSNPQKPYVRPEPPTKDQLRAMLAQAVRNTQPELNPETAGPASEGRTTRSKIPPKKTAGKGRKGRG